MESDFRFFDSRQKYLLFITTTNEKSVVATEISSVIEKLIPKKPALKIFDALQIYAAHLLQLSLNN